MARLREKAVRIRRDTPVSWSAMTAAPTPRSSAASRIAITVRAAVTTPKSAGVSSRASTRVSPRITSRLLPQASVPHRNPRTDRRPTSAAGSGGSGGGSTDETRSGGRAGWIGGSSQLGPRGTDRIQAYRPPPRRVQVIVSP